MSSVLDPAKLKVVELRAELSARGLDAKGNKAVLVKRLKDALEKELKTELPDTSIADTSTEDINTSQTEEVPEKKLIEKNDAVNEEAKEESPDDIKKETEDATTEKVIEKPPMEAEEAAKPEPMESKDEEITETVEKTEETEPSKEENGEQVENVEEPPAKKGRFEQPEEDTKEADKKIEEVKAEEPKETSDDQQTGEKRKRSDEGQKVRPRTPVKEDEPPIDTNKVQLNWYDSDLHLQIDKETFLKAKPYHDGLFGYVWAGVRATHGANSGKVCFEVKVSEELKWEDVIKQPEKGNRDRDRRDSKRDKSKTSSKPKSDEKSSAAENGSEEKSNDDQSQGDTTAEEKMDTTELSESKTESTENVIEPSSKSEDAPKEQSNDDKKTKDAGEDVDKTEEKVETKDGEEVKDSDAQNKEVQMDTDEKKESEETKAEEIKIPPHLIRIGWSTSSESLQLGETKHSYGFESSGKFVSDKQFTEYGKAFGVGDIIGTFLAFSEECVNLIYTINGEELPLAVSIPRTDLPEGEFSLFPHILSKNYAFEVNFGELEEPFCKIPEKLSEYKFINAFEEKILGPQRPETRSDCEVIMMIGLPASGKTHWVNDYLEKNTDKKYTVIGNSQLLEKMTVDGTPFRNSVKPYWNTLVDKLTKTSSKLVDVASTRRRNIVIDQTNEIHSTQRRKMRQFEGYKRRAVVVVCGEEEQNKRKAQYEEQQDTKLSNAYLCQLKANMSLPRVGDWLEEVTYVELKEEDAKTTVQKYNKEGKDAGYGNWPRREARNNRFNKWQDNRRNDYHGGFRNKYPPSRFDRGHKQDYRSPRWGPNDRRNVREPPRDWRPARGSGPRPQDRSRDRQSRPGSRDNYNRNRNQGGRNWQGSGSGGNWNQGGSWSQGSQWTPPPQGGSWNNSNWNSGQGGGKWNYNQGGGGGGYSQQGYGTSNYSGWNNYYGQNWSQNHGSNHSMSGNGH